MRTLLLLLFLAQGAAAFQVPEGFKIEPAVAPEHAQFPMFAAFDDKGRLFVAESSGLDLYAELVALTRKCQVRLLEDRNRDGKFERAQIFADKLVYPMGLAWRDGKLFVADPPDLIALEDTDGDGRADKRSVILTGFGHRDNGSLHGLIFGPDGWLYMTMGSPDGYKFTRPDGSVLQGESGALIRCRPDGSNVEVLARGFENLVEIVFTPEWEIIGTDNWFRWPEAGVRDALVHLVPGGLYPRHKDVGTPHLFTGEPLPAISLYPAVALSGLVRYQGAAFPAHMRGNLFSAQHNTRKVQRHVLMREGSTYRAEDHDFITTTDPDFHPSDVIETPDGALLVLDTGSWYVQHCPTGKIRNSKSRGAIYRVHYSSPAPLNREPAGVRGENQSALARQGALPLSKLLHLLESAEPHLQLAAAEALARQGTAETLPALWNGLTKNPDRLLEHALIYAIHRHAPQADLQHKLAHSESRIQAAALLLLDQPPRLKPGLVLERASSTNAHVRRTAIDILRRHQEWGSQLNAFLKDALSKPQSNYDELESMVLELQKEKSIQELIGTLLANETALVPLLRVIARSSLPKQPPSWAAGIERALQHSNATVRLNAVRASHNTPDAVRKLAEDERQPDDIRLAALRSQRALSTNAVHFLRRQLTNTSNPLHRFAASEILRAQKLLPPTGEVSADAAQKLAEAEPLLKSGDPQRGRAIFFSPVTACATCHAVGSDGGAIGPDLTKIGAIRSGRDLLESILFPSSTFAQGYQPFTVITTDGRDLQGIIPRETADGILLRDAAGAETPIRKDQIREMKPATISLMPTGLEQGITPQSFADLLAYLQSLQ